MEHKILIFDWKGMMAHFRQMDTNSSSLTYSLPPPTAIQGMVAGILGIEKDQYYDTLNQKNMKIAIEIKRVSRKIIQTVNYIKATTKLQLNMSGADPHTQVPMEILVAENFPREPLWYRIFLLFTDEEIFQKLFLALKNRRFKYIPCLGSAPFSSWIEWGGAPQEVSVMKEEEEHLVQTAIPASALVALNLKASQGEENIPLAFFREHMRREFFAGREPGEMIDVLWEKNRCAIRGRFGCPVYRLKFNTGEEQKIVFL